MDVQNAAVAAAQAHRTANGAAILAEFVELLAMPNVSRHLEDVAHVADHIVTMLEARGVNARAVARNGAGPVVVGRLDVPEATETVGIYAHYDGQPVDQPDWQVEPFKPTLLSGPLGDGGTEIPLPAGNDIIDPEWRLYARSTSDDKAPVLAICAALDALRDAAISPTVNLLFLFEGEEEIGSPHLPLYLEDLKDELSVADIWLICDGPVHQSRQPQVVFGVRGISEMELTVFGPKRPLHSGHYGNWARNPNMELAQLLASMKDADGNVIIDGFYDGTQEITTTDRAAVAALPDDDAALRAELGISNTEDNGTGLVLRLLMPSLNIRGFAGGGVGPEAANVIPTHATASIDIRLAPGNDPEDMMDRVEGHISAKGWHIVRDVPDNTTRANHAKVIKVDRNASYPGVRLPTDSGLADSLLNAASVAAGGSVVAVPTFGGSVPLHHFTTILDTPIAITPFANHDNNQHAANENIRVANLWYGIDLMASLMTMDLRS
ncbi:MAG: M20/M25/M40 family metallo-hydrolase [bacterium]|nr:M20/M25/M40 family metallo-hydrolase [bacterium]